MNITSAKYFELKGERRGIISTIDGVSKHVPIDTNNTEYAEILKQVEAGELTIAEAD